jgi:DNA-directed RNA polymerase subunit H (RpoH/RPB5)
MKEKEMNPKVGDVIEIMRKSQTAGESLYYRVVIKG